MIIGINTSNTLKTKGLFSLQCFPISERALLFGSSQTSLLCPSGKGSVAEE